MQDGGQQEERGHPLLTVDDAHDARGHHRPVDGVDSGVLEVAQRDHGPDEADRSLELRELLDAVGDVCNETLYFVRIPAVRALVRRDVETLPGLAEELGHCVRGGVKDFSGFQDEAPVHFAVPFAVQALFAR